MVLGVISNDEDFAVALKNAKAEGIKTLYICSSPELRRKHNVVDSCTMVLDWGALSGEDFKASAVANTGPSTTYRCTVPGCQSPPFPKPTTFKGDLSKIKCKNCCRNGTNAQTRSSSPSPNRPGHGTSPADRSLSPARKASPMVSCSVPGCGAQFKLSKAFKGLPEKAKCGACRKARR